MIPKNELRIGNWVETMSIGTPNQYLQIKYGEEIDYCAIYNNPIPLTHEVLIKLGFIKDRNGFALPDKMSLSFSVTKELGYLACWEDKALHLPYDLKYVHQAQNLYFYLTNDELPFSL